MAARRNQKEHDSLVEYITKELTERKYDDIRADLPGASKPKKVIWQSTGEGCYPDVTGQKSGLRIFEIETADSINDAHTADQWKLFASYADVNNAMFYVVFPKGALGKVKDRLKELALKAVLWEV